MSSLRQTNDIVAICCSDLHLSSRPPVARSAEADWLAAQERSLKQLRDLIWQPREVGKKVKVPVICAGDVFDKPNPGSEIVNFVLESLPEMYAVAGNHDLLHGNYTDIRKTAYWTLVKAGKIHHLEPRYVTEIEGLKPIRLWGFNYGVPVTPCEEPHDLALEIAVIHRYMWINGKSYPNAPEESRLRSFTKQLKGYDIAVWGDNHHSILTGCGNCQVINPGSFFRRTIDEVKHEPCVGLIHADGTIERYYLEVSEDRFLNLDEVAKTLKGIGFQSFVESLSSLGDAAIDFSQAIRRTLEQSKVPEEVKILVLRLLENSRGP